MKKSFSQWTALWLVLFFWGATLGFAGNTAQQSPPIKLGTSGSNVKDINASFCCTGTLGSLVKDTSGNMYILSNNHVLARSNAGKAGETIMQRGYVDTVPVCSKTGTINVAHLSKFVKLNFTGGNNTVDAAIAKIISGQVSTTGRILEIGTLSATTLNPSVGLKVEKSGRTTAFTKGTIGAVNVTVNVSGYGPCGLGTSTAKFVKQFQINSSTFSSGGDSGSLIVTQPATGKKPNPVGLLFAGSSTSTIGNPIKSVLTALGVSFVGSAAGASMEAPADPELEHVSQVKDRYDDYLLNLPGVVGHGVALSQDGSGRRVIVLFLKDSNVPVGSLPTTIEDVSVETQVTGEFKTRINCSHAPGKQ
ncbi:MAG TPA: hypothetical protein VKB49_08645 [Candidatus Sulfotelmatobacter sp.]|nr:hypothetical protein [Candidatus Sulfotelmatobacter sp.]